MRPPTFTAPAKALVVAILLGAVAGAFTAAPAADPASRPRSGEARHSARTADQTADQAVPGAAAQATVPSAGEAWPYLPTEDIGAVAFKQAHPTYDGRGVVLAVLDTGVDAFAPGLQQTSTGLHKLIQVRDFSTEGDWKVEEAETVEGAEPTVWKHPDGLELKGAEGLAVPPAPGDPELPVYFGIIEEKQFLNSRGVRDLNDNGETDDRFGFLVYLADRDEVEAALGVGQGYELLGSLNEKAAAAVDEQRRSPRVWLVAVDTDGDGSLVGEKDLRDYLVNWDSFGFHAPGNPGSRTMMSWEVNVLEEPGRAGLPTAPTVEFHFDDGSHGSHVAGIAAGYQVEGQPTLDGVAAGAWLMSLKIGDNRLSGGATRTSSMRRAYEYAARFADQYGLPVVCNMSFGIVSVEEGDDAMGRWLDGFLPKHPQLVCCLSAGNEGPGLSSIGLPATSPSVISSGAYLSIATGADLYNARLTRPTLFAFSSRGGETAKPDLVSPGSALSTVPGWVEGTARFNGTSMASPQTTGAVACLVSGALQEDLFWHWGMIKRALLAGAKPVPDLGLLDQGAGLLQMQPSWEILRQLAASRSARQVLRYDIETECAFQADGTSDAAYWRTPGGAPVAPERVTFRVSPVFHPDLTADEKDEFFRSFDLRATESWLRILPRHNYIRGSTPMQIDVQYEPAPVQKPGLHAAQVVASLQRGDLRGPAAVEFTLWNSVITGTDASGNPGHKAEWRGRDLPPSSVARHFVVVPPAATSMKVVLNVGQLAGAARGARALTEILDPAGMPHGEWTGYASPEGEQTKTTTILAPDLYPGTWEIDVVSAIGAMAPTDFLLGAAFDGYRSEPDTLTDLARPAAGGAATAELTVTRVFDGAFKGTAMPVLEGFLHRQDVKVKDKDVWEYPFTLDEQAPEAEFKLEVTRRTANLFTDAAVNILDSRGKAVVADGFNGTTARVGVSLPDGVESADYTLQVVAAFAIEKDEASWGFTLQDRRYWAEPITGTAERVGPDEGGTLNLYAGVPTPLTITFERSWLQPPADSVVFGSVSFRDRNLPDRLPGESGPALVLEVPIEVD